MSTVEQMEREFKAMCQKLELARKKKEEEERVTAEEARRAKEATEWKAKEEAEALVREEKAKAAHKQHELAAVAMAEWKWKLAELAARQQRVAEKRAEKPVASGSGLLPSMMRRYKRQAAAGRTEVSSSGPSIFLTFVFCFLFRHQKRKMPTWCCVSGAGR
jgi:hypothetical protein